MALQCQTSEPPPEVDGLAADPPLHLGQPAQGPEKETAGQGPPSRLHAIPVMPQAAFFAAEAVLRVARSVLAATVPVACSPAFDISSPVFS